MLYVVCFPYNFAMIILRVPRHDCFLNDSDLTCILDLVPGDSP